MYLQAQLLEQMSKAPPREHGAAGPDATGPDAKGPDATTRAAEAERRLGSGVQQVLHVSNVQSSTVQSSEGKG